MAGTRKNRVPRWSGRPHQGSALPCCPGAVCAAWRVKDSNLGRHQPTDLQSASGDGLTSDNASLDRIGAGIGRPIALCEAECPADLVACGLLLADDALGVDPQ